jgi:hypothetical protein
MWIPCSAKIGELAIACPRRPAQTRVDVVADPALAELAEVGEVPADLGRVDVRVVRDLL